MSLRICSHCHETKEESEFYPNRIKIVKGREYLYRERTCKTCFSIRCSAYYHNNADEINERTKQRLQDNPERLEQKREYARQQYYNNRENRIAKVHTYRVNNLERVRETKSKYYQQNKEEITLKNLQWQINNPTAHRRSRVQRTARRRARKMGLPDTFTTEQQQFCRQYFNFACAVCGNEEGFAWTIGLDHWIPIADPDCPGTVAWNMVPLCHGKGGCNNSKSATHPQAWLLKQFGPRKAAQILRRINAYFVLVTPSH
jgi:hypothetical protein